MHDFIVQSTNQEITVRSSHFFKLSAEREAKRLNRRRMAPSYEHRVVRAPGLWSLWHVVAYQNILVPTSPRTTSNHA